MQRNEKILELPKKARLQIAHNALTRVMWYVDDATLTRCGVEVSCIEQHLLEAGPKDSDWKDTTIDEFELLIFTELTGLNVASRDCSDHNGEHVQSLYEINPQEYLHENLTEVVTQYLNKKGIRHA